MKKKKRLIFTLLRVVMIFSLGFILANLVFGSKSKVENISYSEVITCVKEGEVSKIEAYQDSLDVLVTLSDGSEKKATVPSIDEFTAFVSEEIQKGATIEFTFEEKTKNILEIVCTVFLILAMMLGVGVIIIVVSLNITIKSITKSIKKVTETEKTSDEVNSEIDKSKSELKKSIEEIRNMVSDIEGERSNFKPVTSKVKFSDVAGIEEEKAQLEEIVMFLKNPEKYHSKGARIPRGILLNGAPGTGKTLLAKAIAGEANVPFFQVNGSSFDEEYVGVGAARVRALFKTAKSMAPCIIFIDEIDSVGQHRYSNKTNSQQQTLNQLLAEMDGFDTKDNVIVMAATNHMSILDEALIRPGRFDRHVFVPMPDVIAREKILKVHARNKYFTEDVSLLEIAKKTVGFSGADLENVLNEAAIYAVNTGNGIINREVIEEAIARVLVGLEKKNSAITKEDKYLTAVHEAGHAIVSAIVRPNVKNFGISIVPRGTAGGYNLFDHVNETYHRRDDLLKQMQVLYGGRIAEELVLGDISTGASSDLEKATKIAYQMITRFAMDEGNLITQIPKSADFNNQLASKHMQKIENLCRSAYDEAEEILESHKYDIHKLAELLMEKEYLSQEEVEEFMSKLNPWRKLNT